MKLHELSPAPGSVKAPKRIGRGTGSGMGKTSTKGHKGQKARSGSKKNGFEGRLHYALFLKNRLSSYTIHKKISLEWARLIL